MTLDPLDWTGGPFLALYAALFLAALMGSVRIGHRTRPPGRPRRIDDPDEFASLAGGEARVAETVAARLLVSGDMRVVDRRLWVINGRDAPVALGGDPELDWADFTRRTAPYAGDVRQRLRRAGLTVDDEEQARRRWRVLVPFALLGLFGVAKLLIGLSRDRPVGFLSLFLILTAMAAIVRAATLDRRTAAGDAALNDARRRLSRLRRAPAPGEESLGVALFGTTVLAGSAYAPLHTLRTAGDGSSTSDSGGGGGGCGGGGGGCGGCSG